MLSKLSNAAKTRPDNVKLWQRPAAIIAECDENLCGTNLSQAERALFTRKRKDAYEALHPETRNGATGRNHERQLRQVGEPEPERFTADTAKRTGQSERAVQRDASRGERVAPEVLSQIARTKLDTGKTLDELASVPMEKQQAARMAPKYASVLLNRCQTITDCTIGTGATG